MDVDGQGPPGDKRVPRHKWLRPAVLSQVPFALVLAVAAVGIVLIIEYHWRRGSTLIGLALLLAAALRMLLSDQRAGLIAIRSKGVDVLCYGGFAVLMIAVSLTITGGPFS
ncbi:MAG: DUF3017 domain-containing protein [Sciscionella sp.]